MPKIDDDVDNILGLCAFYQYIRTAVLSQKQQTRHVSVFTAELFAHYLLIKCLSATKGNQLTKISLADEMHRYQNRVSELPDMVITDCVLFISANHTKYPPRSRQMMSRKSHTEPLLSLELKSSMLVELLQKSAVERLTKFRQMEVREFGSVLGVVTTDYEALYAYKRGDYQRCLQLSAQNVHALTRSSDRPLILVTDIFLSPEFIPLMDDDIVSLIGLTQILNQSIGGSYTDPEQDSIRQLSLSLYLMMQCQIKLHHSVTSLTRTLDYVEAARRKLYQYNTMDHLLVKLIEQKILIHIIGQKN